MPNSGPCFFFFFFFFVLLIKKELPHEKKKTKKKTTTKKKTIYIGENKGKDAKLISAFVFATRIVQFLFF